jgi:adenylate cyclase
MDAVVTTDVFLFEGFRLDRRGLSRCNDQGCFIPVALGSRALEILAVLLARSGELVARDEIMNVVWPGVVVESSNLPVQIAALRRVLDGGRAEGSCIQTVPGRGYRFVAPVTRGGVDVDSPAPANLHDNARPRLSIVVLPFSNVGNNPEQQYFADGITEDVTTDLSRLQEMIVISRNTAFTYRNKLVDTKQIGRELGRYILEGSVRRSGNQVRVNAQLIDAETDAHLWAERFDGETAGLFALQDEITSRIAVALSLELISVEAVRRSNRPDALDFILRGRAALAKPPAPDNYVEAIDLFERALALDRNSVEAQTWVATALASRRVDNMHGSAAADISRAAALAGQALAASPRSSHAHFAKGQVLRAQGRLEEAIPEYEAAVALNRNSVNAIYALGWCKFLTGMAEEAIRLVEQAIRLSPRDPLIASWYAWIGRVHLLQSRTDEAILWLEEARSSNSALAFVHAPLAAAYALRGEIERAAAELAEAQRLSGDDRFSSIATFRDGRYFGVPNIRALYEATYFAGLRKAGMPEE